MCLFLCFNLLLFPLPAKHSDPFFCQTLIIRARPLSNRLSCLQSVRSVNFDPFPYAFTQEALPIPLYLELESSFPEELILNRVAKVDAGSPTRRLKYAEAINWTDLPPIWEDFLRFHISVEFFRSVVRLFEPYLLSSLGSYRLDQLLESHVIPRNIGPSDLLVSDCQFVVNEPLAEGNTSQPPHVDNPKEIYAGLLYVRRSDDDASGGDLTLHRLLQPIVQLDKAKGRLIPPRLHHQVQTIPYRANTFCLFLNSLGAVHSVSPRVNSRVRRRSINIIGEYCNRDRMWNVSHVDSRKGIFEQFKSKCKSRLRQIIS